MTENLLKVSQPPDEKSDLQLLCEKLEHFETPDWAVKAILRKELLPPIVLDPCCGAGVMSTQALLAGYSVLPSDIQNWGYSHTHFTVQDWLKAQRPPQVNDNFGVFMNPPFTLAEKFVDKAFELGARKIVCFQKLSWCEGAYETGKKRGMWWEKRRPARIWVCGDRADCWRHDIPMEKRRSSPPTAYAFFVWERGHAPAAITGHIYKGDAA
jgi:hypothetical protein